MKLALLLLLCACAHGAGMIPAPAQPGDRNAKLVRDLVPYASETAWQHSPYHRLEDFGWPWYVILAPDGTACALFTNVVYLPQKQSYYACPTTWRIARP